MSTLYTALGATEIRLVEILPGAFEDTIALNIHVVDTRTNPSYDALSYVWHPEDGTIDTSKSVELATIMNHQDASIELGTNLDAAIRHFRQEKQSLDSEPPRRHIWIDALSINQRDPRERNHQVALMSSIYSSAQNVLIWLGPEHMYSNFVMDTLSTGHLDVEDVSGFIDCVEIFLRRSWFGRVWIAQELTLARTCPIVYAGFYTMSWDDFTLSIKCMSARVGGADEPFGMDNPDYLACLERADSDNTGTSVLLPRAECIRQLAEIRQNGRSASFSQQFFRTIYLRATDPRDQVYGLLGFSRFGKRAITADYTKSTKQVYEEAVATIMQEDFYTYISSQMWIYPRYRTRDIEVLVANASNSGPASWAPNLQTIGLEPQGPLSIIIPHRTQLAEALAISNLEAPIIEVSEDFSTVRTAGVMLGRVTARRRKSHFGPAEVCDMYKALNLIRDDGEAAIEAMTDAFLVHSVPTPETDRDNFRAALQSCISQGNRKADRDDPAFEHIRQVLDRHPPLTYVFSTDAGDVGITKMRNTNTDLMGMHIAGLFGIGLTFTLNHIEGETYRLRSIARIGNHRLGDTRLRSAADWRDLVKSGELLMFNLV